MTEAAIQAHGLGKSYGANPVLGGLDLDVAAGEIYALLGPNGAGKTTTVRILATLTEPDVGSARVAGADVVRQRHEVRRRIALTGQYAALDDLQTGAENLRMMGCLAGLSRGQARRRSDELLAAFGLVEAAGRRVSGYSGGMRRRLDLAASLMARPQVLFLDEPSTGLDPRARQDVWQVVAELAGGGTTVFLTTQYLEEADRLAGRIAVIDGGRLVAQGTAVQLKARVGGHRVELVAAGAAAFAAVLARLGSSAASADAARHTITVPVDGSARSVRALLEQADPSGDELARFALHSASLDDAFLALTGPAAGSASDAPVEIAHV